MGWVYKHQRVWRAVVLLLLLLAVAGPWTYEQLNVPAQYRCTPPNVRLEGDYCGTPLTGLWLIGFLARGFLETGKQLAFGEISQADLGRELPLLLLALAVISLPFFTTLLLFLSGEGLRRRALPVALLGLALALALLLYVSGRMSPQMRLWGVRLYIGVTFATLALEALAFVARRGARPATG